MLEIKTGRKTEQKETREGAGGPWGGGGGREPVQSVWLPGSLSFSAELFTAFDCWVFDGGQGFFKELLQIGTCTSKSSHIVGMQTIRNIMALSHQPDKRKPEAAT